MASNVAQEIDVLYRAQASSHPLLVQRVSWPIAPLCHSRREVVTQEHAKAHTHAQTQAPRHTFLHFNFQIRVCEGDDDVMERDRGGKQIRIHQGEKVKWWIGEASKKTETHQKQAAFYS